MEGKASPGRQAAAGPSDLVAYVMVSITYGIGRILIKSCRLQPIQFTANPVKIYCFLVMPYPLS